MPFELNTSSLTDASARRVASDIIRQWPGDRPFEVAEALRQSPGLAQHKSVLVDLAYEEFCRAKVHEPSLEPGAFAARYPSIQKTLIRLLEVHEYLEHHSVAWGQGPTEPWPNPGDQFLEFRLVEELGRGALSRVFLAEDTDLANRLAVVKVTRHVEREAGALGRLEHPNIVPVRAVRRGPDTPFSAICMPFLGRATLVDVLDGMLADQGVAKSGDLIVEAVARANGDSDDALAKRGRRGWFRRGTYTNGIVGIGIQLAEALAFAHERDVFHCDVKPSNVLITPDGTPMLLDFNLALSDDLATMAAGGTLPYMAPEQLRWFQGGPQCVDARSDVFSLGATLCELLTGQLPFGPVPTDAQTPNALAEVLLEMQAARSGRMAPGLEKVDPAIAQIIQRAIALDWDDRPQSARELAAALRATQRRTRRFRSWCRVHRGATAVSAASAVVVVGSAIAWGVLREPLWDRQMRVGREAVLAADYQTADRLFSEAWKASPDRPEALFLRGYSRLKADDIQGAYRDLEAYCERTDDGQGPAMLGYCLGKMSKPMPVAIDSFEEAIEKGFVTAAVENDLGHMYALFGDVELGKQHLEEAVRLDPSLAAARFNLCVTELRLAVQEQRCPDLSLLEGIDELDVPAAECHLEIASFLARAAWHGEPTVPQVINRCRAAMAMGAGPKQLGSVLSCCKTLERVPEFVALFEASEPDSSPERMDRLVDPLVGTDFYLGEFDRARE